MNLPARPSDDDPSDTALAGQPRAYVHHCDGTWSFVGDDGWPVSPEEFHAEVMSAIGSVSLPIIDVDPISVTDTEAQ
ncbi:hypothetical protein IU501_01085 [Nocardia otitidiscaviarum]|uniref:hypothetical protein n=1 Tax=Nocardia otitidiscaviarum TaxID=1823 RepID=UPI0018957A33|nr:hypothetical protein [Nocardia otitidiscaviarum]MBF6131599.1 hypothetical protein [Nocardia otitidiscaviarum]